MRRGSWLSLVVLAWAACAVAHAEPVTRQSLDAALPRLDALVRDAMARTGVPGIAIAVVHDGAVVHLRGYGVRAAGTTDAVDPDTVFPLASVSKPMAATVIAALAGDGVLSWDDPVAKHDPGFRLADPRVGDVVTLRDMFAHRSGLPTLAGDLLEDLGYGREEVLRRLRHQRLTGAFRATYAYTNFGLTEAAVAAARAAGRSWEDLAAERLYRPLGMTRTTSRHAGFLAQANRARPHVRGGGGWVVGPQRQPDAQSPAGGVTSSVRDVAQWLRLQLGDGTVDGRRILAADALAEMQRPQIISGRPRDPKSDMASFYGLGLNVGYDARGRVRLGHSGAFLMGAATVVEMAPGDRLGIAVLTNAIPMGVPEAIARSFIEIVQDGAASREWIAVLGPAFAAMMAPTYGTAIDYTVVPAASTPPLAGAYAGRYASDLYGPIEVAETSAGAVLRIGPGPTEYRLVHFDRDVFTWQPPGENAYGPSAVSFAVGADRRAASVTIENLDAHGQGTFARVVASR